MPPKISAADVREDALKLVEDVCISFLLCLIEEKVGKDNVIVGEIKTRLARIAKYNSVYPVKIEVPAKFRTAAGLKFANLSVGVMNISDVKNIDAPDDEAFVKQLVGGLNVLNHCVVTYLTKHLQQCDPDLVTDICKILQITSLHIVARHLYEDKDQANYFVLNGANENICIAKMVWFETENGRNYIQGNGRGN